MGSSSSKPASSSFSSTSSSPLPTDFPSSPAVQRAFSFPTPLVHHLPARKGDTHHLVSLTSTSYGSLLHIDLDGSKTPSDSITAKDNNNNNNTPDPVSPDSVINTWELMDGLDDEFEFEIPKSGKHDSTLNSKLDESYEFVKIEEAEEEGDWVPLSYKPKQPLWKHLSEESFLSGLDPSIISSYKKALSSKTTTPNPKPISLIPQPKPRLQGEEEYKILLYFTSLRGIRKTYEDCCCVRTILRGLQVNVDERDISMDSKYRKELQSMLGDDAVAKPVCLPQVFIRGRHIGGVEEIMRLNDGGELAEMIKDFPACERIGTCRSCGDARFVPCSNCDGSTKVFEEEDERFKRCPKCNENGLVRCRECCL